MKLTLNSINVQFHALSPTIRLITLLTIFATALFIPLGFLADHVYDQFSDKAKYDYQWNAKKVVKHSQKKIYEILSTEYRRPFADYQFYKWVEDPLTNQTEKTQSPLAQYQNIKHIPGYIGHFQIDQNHQFCSPILPYIERQHLNRNAGMDWDEIKARDKKRTFIESLISQSNFMTQHKVTGQINPTSSDVQLESKNMRYERTFRIQPLTQQAFQPNLTNNPPELTEVWVAITLFKWFKDASGHYFFYRNVWHQDEMYLQGFIVNQDEFLTGIIRPVLTDSDFDTKVTLELLELDTITTQLTFEKLKNGTNRVVHSNQNSQTSTIRNSTPISILKMPLRQPLEHLTLAFSTSEIPLGPAIKLVDTLILVFSAVIFIGLWLIYRTGKKQILLAEERLNFVSAVSHELKTPLTSILMYSEMLKEGMVADANKQNLYYNFIFSESERLSRLISNVLEMSRLGKTPQTLNLETCSIAQLQDIIRSKASTQLANNNVQMNMQIQGFDANHIGLVVDQDAFIQIVINLVDNAIKFGIDQNSSTPQVRQIDVGFRKLTNHSDKVAFYVRDYGLGLDSSQAKKVFQLFYRVGNELTRQKPGTGIGLTLVNKLAKEMSGRVEYKQRQPGAEFCVELQAKYLKS